MSPESFLSSKGMSVFKELLTPMIGWVLLSAILYHLGFVAPQMIDRLDDSRHQQFMEFSEKLNRIAETNLTAAKTRDATITTILEGYRKDEQEDRRLFVEILRRSDLTPTELREAIDAAASVDLLPKAPEEN